MRAAGKGRGGQGVAWNGGRQPREGVNNTPREADNTRRRKSKGDSSREKRRWCCWTGVISGKSTAKSEEAKQPRGKRRKIMMHQSTRSPVSSLLLGFSMRRFESFPEDVAYVYSYRTHPLTVLGIIFSWVESRSITLTKQFIFRQLMEENRRAVAIKGRNIDFVVSA